jgi:hypothetical protein
MGLGVLEDRQTPFPPGTCVLTEKLRTGVIEETSPEYDIYKKDGFVVLQPQPSDSPNDPYNWSDKHKYLFAALLIVTGTTIGGTQSMLGTGQRILAERYHTTFPEVVKHLTPPRVISHAFGLLLASAVSAVYGKRVQYVCAVFVIAGEMLAGYFANSLNYYTGLAIVGGFASSPLELLMGPIITDMIYVHKRGRLMGLTAVVAVIGQDARSVLLDSAIHQANCTL